MPRERYSPAPERSVRRLILRGIGVHLYRHPYIGVAALIVLTLAALVRVRDVEVSTNLRTALPMAPEARGAWDASRLAALRHNPVMAVVRLNDEPARSAPRDRVARAFAEAWSDPAWLVSVREESSSPDSQPRASLGYDEMLKRLRVGDVRDLADLGNEGSTRYLFYQAWGAPSEMGESKRVLARSDPSGVFQRLFARGPLPLDESAVVCIAPPTAQPSERVLVFRLNPVRSSSDAHYCVRLRRFLERTAAALVSGSALPGAMRPEEDAPGLQIQGVEVDFSGPHMDTARVSALFVEKLVWLLGVLGVCLVLLTILAFRKAEAVFFVGVPATLGLVWTYGAIGWIHPRVNLLSALLPLLLLGLAWEFSFQIYHRFVEELYRTRRYYPALTTAYTEAGRGILVATIATSLIFATLFLSGTAILHEWALVGVTGTVAMALSALLVLPVLASLKSLLAREKAYPLETYDFGLKQFSAMVTTSPRTMLVLGLMLTAWLTGFAREMKINRGIGLDLIRATDAAEGVGWPLGVDPTLSILVEGDDLQEALERNDRLYENLLEMPGRLKPLAIRSLSPELPALSTQLAVRRALAAIDLRQVETALRMSSNVLTMGPGGFGSAVAAITGLRKAAASVPLVDLEFTAPERLVALGQTRIARAGGRCYVRTTVLPRGGSTATRSDFSNFRRFASRGLPRGTLQFDSETLQNRRLAYHVIYGLAISVLLSGVILLACLLPHFHGRWGDTLLALLPLACSAVWTVGALSMLGRRIGLYTLLVFPLVVGILVCQSILLIQRLYDRRYASLRQVVRLGGRPGVISGVALMLGLGCLNPLPFPALESMTTAALFAVGFGVAGVLFFVPALLEIRRQGGMSAWADDPEEALAEEIGREAPDL